MANIFSNFGNKVGNAFTNLGQGGNLFNANPTEIAALSEEDRRRLKREGLERFANSLGVAAAIGSGDPQRMAMAQNKMRQAKIDKENARVKADQKAKQKQLKEQQDAFIKANPQYAKMINMNKLFGVNPPAKKDRKIVLQNGIQYYADTGEQVLPNAPDKTPLKKSKNDFVVGILEKIQADPNYELTTADQRILDTIADTDPMKIMVRNRLNEMQTSKFSNENNNQSGPVTVTTQKEFDDLPKGTPYIYNGTEYVKGQ
tara:strand:- start:579 stop:1352 length:774 start_codon:yes stop_codon:yes gene_type:complete